MKLYVLVRKDLKISYQAVQAGHAVAEWMLHDSDKKWQNSTLVYLGVKDENELEHWKNKLDFRKIKFVDFKEPDIGNKVTAISCLSDGRVFRNLKLL